jgi:hypothetical protein
VSEGGEGRDPAPYQAAAVSKIFARPAAGSQGRVRHVPSQNAWIAEKFEALAKAVN